ncbi:hypothetical protein [Allomesorhizobium alhagi]|uniref:Uncharacterized protein n=1 Tax=Mesorhizobium alhagi CCNWXJ12-2 TaxID=1107882 RepID=H0I123_9HYPH|nr:hypothetical protein [Mesorhizobium alhagi]EHK53316.1 hypothetical protein MAXJ12_30802 [Mesorhizobium alhagi CCNWXJ12-2]
MIVKIRSKFVTGALALCAMVSLPMGGTFAQAADETPAQGACRVEPEAGNHEAEKLERCEGVLKPQRVGDRDIVEPAPDIGVTPVMPPRALSEQQSDDTTGGDDNPVSD